MDSHSRRRVLFIITKSNWGGAQRYVYDLATALPKHEFEVQVAFGQPGRLADALARAGIETYSIAALQRDVSLVADFRSFLELWRLLRTMRPDIVHLNSSKAAGLGALAARITRVPRVVFTVHGWPFAERRNLVWRMFAFLASWTTAILSHSVIVVSKNDLRIGTHMPFCRRKIHLIYNGIATDIPFASGEVIRNAFPPSVRITGTIGELTRNKNQIALVNQAKNDPTLFVAIVGEGEERTRLEAMIANYHLEDRVKLFGFMPSTDVLRGFDIFSLPSLKEGLPYVLLEARTAGIPIVANRVGGVADILDAPDMETFSLKKMVDDTTAEYYR